MFSEKSINDGKTAFVELLAEKFLDESAILVEAKNLMAKNAADIEAAELKTMEVQDQIQKAAAAAEFDKLPNLTAQLQAVKIPPTLNEELSKQLASRKLGAEFGGLYDAWVGRVGMADSKVRASSGKTAEFSKTAITTVYKGQTVVAARFDKLPEKIRQQHGMASGDWLVRHGDARRVVKASDATSPTKLTQSIKQSDSPQSKAWYNGCSELTQEAVAVMI